MNSSQEPPGPEMTEPFVTPEFFITQICKAELVDGPCVRVYCCAQRDTTLEIRCTLLIPLTRVAAIARQCVSAAHELHFAAQWTARDDGS